MFGWFRSRKPVKQSDGTPSGIGAVLAAPIHRQVEIFLQTIQSMDMGSRAMILLAYPTAKVITDVMIDISVNKGEKNLPSSYEEAVEFAFRATDEMKTEIGQRRSHWIAFATLLLHLSREHPEKHINEAVATIWMALFSARDVLREYVKTNVVFSEEEKEWYKPTTDLTAFTMMMAMQAPKHLRSCVAWNSDYV